MRRPKRAQSSLALLLLVAAGCASTRSVPVGGAALSIPRPAWSANGIEVVGYETSDGIHHAFHGTARLHDQEWVFVSSATWGETQEKRLALPGAEVQSLDVVQGAYRNPFAVAGLVAGIAVVVMSIVVAIGFVGWRD